MDLTKPPLPLPTLPLVLQPNRLKSALVLMLVAVCFVFVFFREDGLTFNKVVVTVAGIVAVVFSAPMLIPGQAYLRLTEEGFAYRVGWRTRSVPWSEVARVEARKTGLLSGDVFWMPAHPAPLPPPGALPFDPKPEVGVLPGVYDMRPEQLAALMNRLRAQVSREVIACDEEV